jgi:phosphatidylglycerol---prolipoprotein diacylglyceryl transferase
MRPVLVHLPSKVLFVVALLIAVVAFGRELHLWRKADRPLSWTPLVPLALGWVLLWFRAGTWVPSPAAFARPWPPLPVHSYGLFLTVSMIGGWFVAARFARQEGISVEQAASIYLWTAVWSIVGARLLYVVVMWRSFHGFWEIFTIQRGGLVAYGGMIGGVIASAVACRRRGVPLLRWADAAAPSVVLGTAITRMGCFLFGCDYGKPTTWPWGVAFPAGSPAWRDHVTRLGLPRSSPRSLPVHPTQLYEALSALGLFLLLLWLRQRPRFAGQVFLAWVIGYGLLRPAVELFRDDRERGWVGPLSTSQAIGLGSVVLGIAGLTALWRRHQRVDPAVGGGVINTRGGSP